MSNAEKRDERSMSDILASIRKIMAQEPAATSPPPPGRSSLNGVSEPVLELPPREFESKIPDRRGGPEGTPAAAEPVSLDELLADTPQKPSPSAVGEAAKTERPTAATPGEAPEWLFPRARESQATDNKSPSLAAEAKDAAAPQPASVKPAPEAGPAQAISGPATSEHPAKEDAPARAAVPPVPPAPKVGDLGSVVPGKRDNGLQPPALAMGPPTPSSGDRPVLGPPLAGPLLGEPARAPVATETQAEVPGADALRRLIAGVIPPSAHPAVTPAAKAPEIAPAPTQPPAARGDDAPKSQAAAAKPAPEIKAETKAASAQPPITKAPETKVPGAPAPPVAAASPPVSKEPEPVSPPPKPVLPTSVPTRAAKLESGTPAPASTPQSPIASAAAPAPASSAKTMDETVVELLRPLLRDWLNTNMPRLIEPALKAELEALRDAAAKEKKD